GAYDMDKALKDESPALIDKAKGRTSYSSLAADVEALMQNIDSAISAEKARTKNDLTVAQWQTIKSQLSHFFDLWKTKGTLSPAFVDEGKNQVSGLFDTLIRTEEDKRATGLSGGIRYGQLQPSIRRHQRPGRWTGGERPERLFQPGKGGCGSVSERVARQVG